MTLIIKIFCVLSLAVLYSCSSGVNPSDEPPIGESIPYLVDTLLLDEGAYTYIETPLFWEDKLILMLRSRDGKRGWINCYDRNTYELRWTWDEAHRSYGDGAMGFSNTSYIHDGILAIGQSNLSYAIDISDGSTIWHNRGEDNHTIINGINETIVTSAIIELTTHRSIRKANISNGTWTQLDEIIKTDSLNVAMYLPTAFEWEGNEYCTYITAKWNTGPAVEHYWLNLYNLTEDKLEWTTDTIPLEYTLSGIPGGRPAFADGQILLANDAIYSYNIEDGSLEWWQWYGNTFVFSTHLQTDGSTVYANNESKYMLALDVHTGAEHWRTETGGSASKIAYSDNKCYISDATNGGYSHLQVLDAQTGEMLQDETAPFYKVFGDNKQWNFDDVVAVDDQTGRVYTADHKYLLVYEF